MSVYPAALPTVRPAVRGAFEQGSGGGAASIIAGLFAQGRQGFWLPFTDFASLSQDSAGTLPYTALEQPVGRVLDRSGRGNHASQVTSTARGIVSARVNLLTKTEQFVQVGKYLPTNITVTENAGTAPDGTGTAIKLAATASATTTMFYEAALGQTAYRHIWYIKKGTLSGNFGNALLFRNTTTSTNVALATIDFVTGVVTNTIGAAFSSTNAGDGWWKITGTVTSGFAATDTVRLYYGWNSVVAPAGDFIFVWHPDCRHPSLFNNAVPDYQRVTTATDYDSVGFPKYLKLDGTDDFYTCGGGGSTTGFYYSAVIRPMGGAGTGRFLLSDRIGGQTGYMVALTAENKFELALGSAVSNYTRCASTDSIDVGTQYFVEAFDDGVNLQVAVNGGTPVTVPRSATPSYGGSAMMLYKNTIGGDGIYNGQITEPIYRAGTPPSAYERDVIRNYQMQKAGL